jgi:hypothetical protein
MVNNEYRITRPSVYGEGTLGYKDKSARQGYYVTASSEREAVSIARKLYNERISSTEPLDVQLWKTGV